MNILSLLLLLPASTSFLARIRASPVCTADIPCDWAVPNDLDTHNTTNRKDLARRDVWNPVGGGCWFDSSGLRTLERPQGIFTDLTPSKCQSLCEAQGFGLAGVEFSRECYCGNTIMGNNTILSDDHCRNPCTGDPSQFCGGPQAIFIYAKANYQYTHGPASAVDSYDGYQNTQCWAEPQNHRILTGSPAQAISADSMTVQKCIDGCKAAGYSSAGVEFGSECFCGYNPVGQSVGMDECNMPCNGDGSQLCGGAARILIYTNSNLAPSFTPANFTISTGPWAPAQGGCWHDNIGSIRALEHSMGNFNDLTIEKCLALCDNQGFSLAGVQNSGQCFCGNTIMGNNTPAASNICNMPCSGDPRVTCGGAGAIQIYVKNNYPYTTGPASPLTSYDGWQQNKCWFDQSASRLLIGKPSPAIPGGLMTVQKCISGCETAGFNTSGVEYGQECYCGNVSSTPGQVKNIDDCNMPCKGDASEYCGGPNRILLYQKQPTLKINTTIRGILQVIDSKSNSVLGYISKHPILGGAGYRYQPSASDAVHVTFTAPEDAKNVTGVELATQDSDVTAYPFLGLVMGHSFTIASLIRGSLSYAYICSTKTVPTGSIAKVVGNSYTAVTGEILSSESHTWNIDLVTGDATLTWINADGNTAALQYFTQNTALYVGGDVDAFRAKFASTVTSIKFKFLARP